MRQGEHPTFHLADEEFFVSLERKPYFINPSRGETTDTQALMKALAEGRIAQCCIDVWEHEPHINLELLERCHIGTPHIAGYSCNGKANATRMSLAALAAHFGLADIPNVQAPSPKQPIICANNQMEALLQIYNPHTDSQALKARPEFFEQLRGNYPIRHEEQAYEIKLKQ